MSQVKARAAFRQRLLTLTGLPVQEWQNKNFTPVVGTPWLRETLLPVGERLTTFGGRGGADGLLQNDALYQITLFYPADGGTMTAETMAEAVLQLFKPGTVLSYQGISVVCRRAQVTKAIQEPIWYGVPVIVNYYFHRPNS